MEGLAQHRRAARTRETYRSSRGTRSRTLPDVQVNVSRVPSPKRDAKRTPVALLVVAAAAPVPPPAAPVAEAGLEAPDAAPDSPPAPPLALGAAPVPAAVASPVAVPSPPPVAVPSPPPPVAVPPAPPVAAAVVASPPSVAYAEKWRQLRARGASSKGNLQRGLRRSYRLR